LVCNLIFNYKNMIEQVILVGLIIGLTQIVKQTGKINVRYIPIVAIFFGVVINLLSEFAGAEIAIGGITAGLIAMGMWSGTGRVAKKETEEERLAREKKQFDNLQ